jgi:hypothetical protein
MNKIDVADFIHTQHRNVFAVYKHYSRQFDIQDGVAIFHMNCFSIAVTLGNPSEPEIEGSHVLLAILSLSFPQVCIIYPYNR